MRLTDYATRVLEKHWPGIERFRDVRTCGAHNLAAVDVICGGFPCQPHSLAGRRAASADERDLWGEFARIIREVGPRWVVAENVPGLLSSESGRFFGRVLRDLAESGYDAEWDCIPASAVGAHHRRDRVWLVGYPRSGGRQQGRAGWTDSEGRRASGDAAGSGDYAVDVADSDIARSQGMRQERASARRVFTDGHLGPSGMGLERQWLIEPSVGRVAHGIPARVDRLRCLGNAVVPQIPTWIASRILDAEGVTV